MRLDDASGLKQGTPLMAMRNHFGEATVTAGKTYVMVGDAGALKDKDGYAGLPIKDDYNRLTCGVPYTFFEVVAH